MTLEESKPEDLSTLCLELCANPSGQIVVHDVFEVDFVKVVSPRMKHSEALVLDALSAVLLNVFFQELEVSLIGVNRVAQIISVDFFLLVANKRANGLDA